LPPCGGSRRQYTPSYLWREVRILLDGLGANVGAIDDEGSADLVDPAWVVSTLDIADVATVAADWIRRVGESRGEVLGPTDASATAVRHLFSLCSKAISAGAEVVCVWYL
jgi:hypothetical protein